MMPDFSQDNFDLMIGRLDRVLSVLVNHAKNDDLDPPNRQTLKHHAEDMAAAAECILDKLKKTVGTPQPIPFPQVRDAVELSEALCGDEPGPEDIPF